MGDSIVKPDHYTWHPSGIECRTIVQEFDYNIGTAMAYLWRCGHKHDDPLQDLRKARKHLDFEIERLEGRKREREERHFGPSDSGHSSSLS